MPMVRGPDGHALGHPSSLRGLRRAKPYFFLTPTKSVNGPTRSSSTASFLHSSSGSSHAA